MATIKQMLDVCGTIEKAEEMARDLVNKDPNYLMDLYLVLSSQGKFKEAEGIINQIVESPIRAFYNRGYLEMMKGRMNSGFVMMNYGRMEGLWNCPFQPNDPKLLWRGDRQNLKNKHLLFICEAGFGDQIIFVRFVKQFIKKGALVTIACSKELVNVFSRIPNVYKVIETTKENIKSTNYDYWTPAMFAPVSLQITFDTLENKPYITPTKESTEKFKEIIRNNDKLKIGIRWLGQQGDDYITRVFPEQLMFDAVNSDKFDVYSLQKDIDNRSKTAPYFVHDLDEQLNSWDDTIGAIQNLDLIVTSCTSIAHIAGALGKPTWVIIPILPYYIWCYSTDEKKETTPWYKNVRLFRQTKFNKWNDIFNNIKNDLNSFNI